MSEPDNKLIIVSNRLPVVIEKQHGQHHLKTSAGGLVTALEPALNKKGGCWIGWPGISNEVINESRFNELILKTMHKICYQLKPVLLTENEINDFYYGFSNEIIWPLFHDLQARCNFDPHYWKTYQNVNLKFAEIVIKNANMGDYIWVHDYHLMLVAYEIRNLGYNGKIGFFFHTPFPSQDIFFKLPYRLQILDALLYYDLIGFQTRRDRNNFIQCINILSRDVKITKRRRIYQAITKKKKVSIGSFPISIDYNYFKKQSRSKEVIQQCDLLKNNIKDQCLILGIDRLDYTKGIPYRLKAFENALANYPEIREKITFTQVVVPSRDNIPEYITLKKEIDGLVGKINGRFASSGWIPIHYYYRNLTQTELIAYYKVSDIALVTPLKDGMNLIAKEYCACHNDVDGVLILSEFAGAARQFYKGALLVNPYDEEGIALAIYRAFKMSKEEKKLRMAKMLYSIKKYDIFWWVNDFLKACNEFS